MGKLNTIVAFGDCTLCENIAILHKANFFAGTVNKNAGKKDQTNVKISLQLCDKKFNIKARYKPTFKNNNMQEIKNSIFMFMH